MHVEGGRVVAADISAKSMRKAKTMIAQFGTGAVNVLIQGRLAAGDVLIEGGLVAQVKVPRPAAPTVEAEARRDAKP